MPRFVVLFHETPAGAPRPSHWDVMFEVGAALRTWALAEAPDAAGLVAAELLADHRLDYLDYEGPISGNRGSVVRWDQGTYQIESQSGDRWQLALAGDRLVGTAVLERDQSAVRSASGEPPAAQRWTFFFGAAPSTTSAAAS